MQRHPDFHTIHDHRDAIERRLAPGILAHIYPGDQAMISVVTFEAGASGSVHHHPQEQWGLCLEGSGIRVQGDREIPFAAGDFWRTPGGVPHTIRAGAERCRVLDVFAPPREEYCKPGSGFGGE